MTPDRRDRPRDAQGGDGRDAQRGDGREPGRDGRDAQRGDGREPGRDGVTGLLSQGRWVRAREVARPTETDVDAAAHVLPDLLARAHGRRQGR